MSKLNLNTGLLALAGVALSVNVSAADLTCSDIAFTQEAFDAYESVDKACLEMTDREGITFAKLTAVISAQVAGSTYVRFRHSDGTTGPRHKSALAKDFETMISGKAVKLAALPEGQEVNIYVGDTYWSAPVAEVAEAAPAAAAAPPPPPPPPPAPEPEPEPEPEVLPTTAGPLPLVALLGSLFLLIGGAMRYSRRQQ